MTQEQTIIRINWSGPFVVEDTRKPGAKNAKASFRKGRNTPALNHTGKDIGVYQIYGKHLIYGGDVLLYIGMAPKTSFAERISAHMTNWEENWGAENTVHVGRLDIEGGENPKSKPRAELIEVAEKLLIHHHSPAFNGGNIETLYWRPSKASVFLTHNNVRVKNRGDRRCLESSVRNF